MTLLLPKPVRIRSERHLRWIRTLRCSVPGCFRTDIISHHLTIAQPKARGLKAGDQFAVPLCEGLHHAAEARCGVHRVGDERAWWAQWGLDPVKLAELLWDTGPEKGRAA
ncbi:MAG: hypothetical protein P4L90_26005 [Rhodopila sp.]|nr:hypothetical protein [Rhodopila sp.]